MTQANVQLPHPAVGAFPVLFFGQPATAATGAAPTAAPAMPRGTRVRAALGRAIATGRASHGGVLLALAVAAAARFALVLASVRPRTLSCWIYLRNRDFLRASPGGFGYTLASSH